MKRLPGRPSKENVSPVGTNLRSDEIMAQEVGESRNQINRYTAFSNRLRELDLFEQKPLEEYLHTELCYGGESYAGGH